MGSHMAMNLIKSGYKVSVHDLNPDATKPFLNKGVAVMETPSELAQANDVIITMLPSSAHVLDVYTGPNGLLHNGTPLHNPWLFIDSSTIDPRVSRKLSVSISGQENRVMLDAPVSGGILAAEAGTLTFMVGGPEDAYVAAGPLFQAMGRASVYCGGAGNGSVAKICNNLAMGISMIGVSEALAVGQSLGIEAGTLSRVLNSSSGRCWSSDNYNPVPGVMEGVPASRDYRGGFASKLMAKDLDLAAVSAEEAGVKHPFTGLAKGIFNELCKEGHEAKDFSCVFRYYYGGKDEF